MAANRYLSEGLQRIGSGLIKDVIGLEKMIDDIERAFPDTSKPLDADRLFDLEREIVSTLRDFAEELDALTTED